MSVKRQVVKGVKWTSLSALTLAVTSILKISILTRYLEKSDFGLVALVTFVLGFMELFNDMGLTSAILHKQDITKKQYASLFWLNLLTSIVLYGVICLISAPISNFYNQPQLSALIPLLGLNLIASGFGRQFKVVKQKELMFQQISIIEMFSAILSVALAFLLAINDFGIFSLIYSTIFQYFLTNIAYLIAGIKYHPIHFHFRISETKPFLKIGSYQVGGQIANYFNRDLDVLLVGKFFSPEILGGYSLAKQLVFRPAQFVNPILVKVASPALAKYQNDIHALKSNYLKLVNIVSSINIPLYLGIAICAPWIVRILYGPGFENINILVSVLSIYMIFRAIGNPVGSLVIASGRTDLEFLWNLITLIVMPIFVVVGAYFGIIAVTVSLSLAMVLLFYPSWKFLINKIIKASFKEYIVACFKLDFVQFIRRLKS